MRKRIAVRGIVLHEGKLLCVQLKPYNEFVAAMNGAWCLPGGGLEPGEGIISGVKREMLEETGVAAEVGNLLYIQQFASGTKSETLEFFFHITNSRDFLNVDLSKTSHGEEEIQAIEFVDPAAVSILPAFLMTEDLFAQAASPQPPKVFSFVN